MVSYLACNRLLLDKIDQGKETILDLNARSPYIKLPLSEFNHQTDIRKTLTTQLNLKEPIPKIRVTEFEIK